MRPPAALGGAFLLLSGAAALAVLLPGGSSSDGNRSTQAVVAYQARVLPIVKDWGSVEVLGMRPAVSDLRAGTALARPEVVAAQARAWRASFNTDRARLAALTPPTELRSMASLMDDSLRLYLEAVDRFLDATKATGAQRRALIDQAISTVREGASVYDRASEVLHRVRKSHGLPLTQEFPHATAAGRG